MSVTYQHSDAEQARLWADPAFKATAAAVREQLINEWENTRAEEADKRENLYQQLCALRDVTGLVADGALQDEIDKTNEDA